MADAVEIKGSSAPEIREALASVLEDLPDALILLDRTYRIAYANRLAREVSRIQTSDMQNQALWDMHPGLVDTAIQHAIFRVMETRAAEALDDFYYEPFRHWVRMSVRPAGDHIALYYRDVTEERCLKEERRISEERVRLALEAAKGVGIWSWDIEGNRVYGDESLAELFGLRTQQVQEGLPVEEFTAHIYPADLESVNQAIARAMVAGDEAAIEYRIRRTDGELRWIASHGRVVSHANGRQFAGINLDVTDRKQTEEALIRAEKLAVVGRMASSIAHEINNPLESVMNLLFLARQAAILPSVQEYLDTAEQELRRVSVIANQTLRFHKQATRPTAITCQDLYSTVLSLFEGKLKNSNITVENRQRAEKPVACFEGDIRQVLNNLVGNAIDAMPLGGRLLIRSREATDWRTGERGVVLTVADTGTGIARENMHRVFEAFFTTKGFSGTGLGLWVSHEIVERHGGRLTLRSSTNPRNHGTVTAVFLPFHALERQP